MFFYKQEGTGSHPKESSPVPESALPEPGSSLEESAVPEPEGRFQSSKAG